ncbi:MAG: hypothetical protein ACKO96_19915, partial [Flammeovirgaceae bacterium]
RRRSIFGIVSFSLVCLALMGCGDASRNAETRFIRYCRDFQFVHKDEKPKLAKIRSLIERGEINLDSDFSFRTVSIDEDRKKESPDHKEIQILTIDVTSTSGERFFLMLPQTKLRKGDSISIFSSKYVDVDCFSIIGKTYYDFVQGGVNYERFSKSGF